MIAGIGSWCVAVKNTSKFLQYIGVLAFKTCYAFTNEHGKKIRSPGHAYVEGDASSASYFLAGAAVTGGTVTVEGCGTSSLQVATHFHIFCSL